MKSSLIASFTFFLSLIYIMSSYAQDFRYTYTNPNTVHARKYIVSYQNAELYTEGTVTYWKPILGGTSVTNTQPAEIIYHFKFPGKKIERAFLSMYTSCYHWWYSRGQTYIFAGYSPNDWSFRLAEAGAPEYGTANYASYADWLPDGLLHEDDIWLKVELYSYGERAPWGGIWTNTAQHSRYQLGSDIPVFRLSVYFHDDDEEVERPMDPGAIHLLLGAGGLGGPD